MLVAVTVTLMIFLYKTVGYVYAGLFSYLYLDSSPGLSCVMEKLAVYEKAADK